MTVDTKILTVSQLNDYVKMLIDSNPMLGNIWVRGEVSNLTFHTSGHLYFSVKDEKSRVSAIMFRTNAVKLKFRPENGMKVVLHGRVSVFPRDGVYQIYVTSIEPDGIGALYIAYEQLRRRLEAEGLFDERIKKALPKIPSAVGVITSPTGAAVRDIINVTARRFPFAKIILFPSLVQGDGAESNLIEGIRYFNSARSADVIIIGRGGGSIEDLGAFNSELLAREIRMSAIPVISAVGHETDYTICDFAADRRAPTPSAAAELAVPDAVELKRKLGNVTARIENLVSREIKHIRERLKLLSESRVLTNPTAYIEDKRVLLVSLSRDIERGLSASVREKKNQYIRISTVLQALSPLKVISKGYSAVFNDEGKLVKSIKDVDNGDHLSFRVSDGVIGAEVTSIIDEQPKTEKTS